MVSMLPVQKQFDENAPAINDPLVFFGGEFSRFPRQIREQLLLFAAKDAEGRFELSDSAIKEVKSFLKGFLGLPDRFSLTLFTDASGSAIHASRYGELLLDGFVTVERPHGLHESIPLECNLSEGTLTVDDRRVEAANVGAVLLAIENEFNESCSIHEVLRRAAVRAHLPFFKGSCEEEGKTLLITTNPGASGAHHLFYGTPLSMERILVRPEATMVLEFGLLLQGRGGSCSATVLVPWPNVARDKIVPSFNGKKVTPERFLLNGTIG